MDRPLVYLLAYQGHGRVAKSGRDKRWRHLSVKPPSRWDIPSQKRVRPLEDDEVDRSEVEVQQCMELTDTNRSRAWPEGLGKTVVAWLFSMWFWRYMWKYQCASGSVVEHHLAKVGAAGSNPVSRSFYFQRKPLFSKVSAVFVCSIGCRQLTKP